MWLLLDGWRGKLLILPSPGGKGWGAGQSHVVILRSRSGRSTFFYPRGQNLSYMATFNCKRGWEISLGGRSWVQQNLFLRVEKRSNIRRSFQCAESWYQWEGFNRVMKLSWELRRCVSTGPESRQAHKNQGICSHLEVRATQGSESRQPGRTKVPGGIWIIQKTSVVY